jgi:hypothetical protein
LARRFRGELALGLREGLATTAPDGRILSSAVGFGAGLRYLLLRTSNVELGVSLGARAAVVRLQGQATPTARDAELSGLVAYARSSLSGAVRVTGPLWLELGVGAGAPLRALEATDASVVVTGVSGFELPVYAALFSEL